MFTHFYDPSKPCPALCGGQGLKVVNITSEVDFVTCIECWRILIKAKQVTPTYKLYKNAD